MFSRWWQVHFLGQQLKLVSRQQRARWSSPSNAESIAQKFHRLRTLTCICSVWLHGVPPPLPPPPPPPVSPPEADRVPEGAGRLSGAGAAPPILAKSESWVGLLFFLTLPSDCIPICLDCGGERVRCIRGGEIGRPSHGVQQSGVWGAWGQGDGDAPCRC